MTLKTIRRLLCLLGFHEFQVLEVTAGFGQGVGVAKVKCKHCAWVTTRPNRD